MGTAGSAAAPAADGREWLKDAGDCWKANSLALYKDEVEDGMDEDDVGQEDVVDELLADRYGRAGWWIRVEGGA